MIRPIRKISDFTRRYHFNKDVIYQLDMRKAMTYGPLNAKDLAAAYKDGRVAGLVNEYMLAKLFIELIRAPNNNCAFDLQDSKWGTTYEVKTMTKGGAATCPSNMIGAGRKYEVEGHKEKLAKIDYFIFVDVRDMPNVTLLTVKADHPTLMAKKVTKRLFEQLLNEDTE